MENQNMDHLLTLSLNSIPKGSEIINNVVPMTENVKVDAGSVTEAKSGGSNSAPVKRGRGRPPKYRVVGNPLPPMMPPVGLAAIQSNGSEEKRGRGRPRGSGKLQISASIGECVAQTAGGSMTPHVLTVYPGEDVVGKIFSFFQTGPEAAVCILSAIGTVSSVIFHQPSVSNGFLRYEGHFDILSISGSCTFIGGADGCAQRKIGMLSVSLAKPDGSVFGGGIENSMIAATPIQLVLGTFKQHINN